MTQPPQPPNEPPQGGFGAPQDPPPSGYATPQPPPAPPQGPPSAPPNFAKPPEQAPAYGSPAPPPPGQPPQTPPPPGQPPVPPAGQPAQPTQPAQPGQPGQPGYGYPQASAAQQPTVVAQPSVGAQQGAPYGYPGQQQYGGYQAPTMPQQAVSGGKKFNAQVAIIVAAVVAIALIVGGGVWYSKSGSGDSKNEASSSGGKSGGSTGGSTGGDNKNGQSGGAQGGSGGSAGVEKVPANTSAKVLFQLPAPEVPKDAVYSVMGSWLYEKADTKIYAKAGVNKIVGYDATSGKEAWTLPLAGQTCGFSPEVTDDGIGAVVYESGKRPKPDSPQPCSKVSTIDLKTGTLLWTKEVKAGDQQARYEEVSISGNTVAAGGGTDGGAAFDLKTGKPLWTPQTGDCQDVGYTGGAQLVAVRSCGAYDNPKISVQLLDATSGKPKWTYDIPAGIDNAKVFSSKPVVFGVEAGDAEDSGGSGVTDVFSLDDAGHLRAKISLTGSKYDIQCEYGDVHNCHGIVVGNDKIYLPTEEHQGTSDYGQTNEIISYDLATGKTTGDRGDAGERYKMFPLRMDGSNILAYKDGPYDKGAQIVSLDSKTMKPTTLLETPASQNVLDALMSMVPNRSEVLYGDGLLFLGKALVSKPYSADEKSYTALGFSD